MIQNLPVYAHRDEIVRMARKHPVIIVVGETGSGKTTCVPRFLYEAGFCNRGRIAITEPRRIAAVSVATFVAEQMGESLGGTVGYRIRHENRTGPDTKLAYMTEGVLLRELLADRMLSRYDVLVLDETHERGLFQDLLMALVKNLRTLRPELTIVIMSATINEQVFSAYFDDAPVVHIEGRMFPVDIVYRPDYGSDPAHAAADAAIDYLAKTDGDILVFQPDYATIRDTMEILQAELDGVDVLPLYGSQAPEEQMRVFKRERRSVIVSTNIAETSVTLDGVTAVIDTGLIKEMRFYPRTSTSSLQVTEHSQAGCDQRAGRAGRVAPGICVRLYDEESYQGRSWFTTPEILRTNLDGAYLQLRAMGFSDAEVRELDYMSSPQGAFWANARETVTALGALDKAGELTDMGETMAAIPLPPVVSKMVLSAKKHRCVRQVVTIAATFSTRPVFVRPMGQEDAADEAHKRFRHAESDFLSVRNAIERWRKQTDRKGFAERNFLHPVALEEIEATELQLMGILDECGIDAPPDNSSSEAIEKSVAAGLIANLLTHGGGGAYKKRRCEGIFLFPGSVVAKMGTPPVHVVCADIVETRRMYARQVQVVSAKWLDELLGTSDRKHRKQTRERFRNQRNQQGRRNGGRR